MVVELSIKELLILEWLKDNEGKLSVSGSAMKVKSLTRFLESLKNKGLIDYKAIQVKCGIKTKFGNVYDVFLEDLSMKDWKILTVDGNKVFVEINQGGSNF